jgi:hypothetical protein
VNPSADQGGHGALQPDRELAAAFLRALTGSEATPVTFQTFVDAGQSRLSPSNVHTTLNDAWEGLCEAQESGHGVFVMVNEGDGRGRSSANVRALRALFADADEGPVPVELLGSPSMIVRSGRGEHYYWLLAAGEPLDAFTPAQKAIAAKLGTDPKVCDLPRVLRLPGTFNLKDRSNPRFVELVACDTGARRTITEVVTALGAGRVEAPEAPTCSAAPAGPLTLASEARFRAEQYVAKVHAVQGAHGDNNTFRVASALLRDFALDRVTAWEVFKAWNRTNAQPPWNENELGQKFANASKYATRSVGSAFAADLPAANEPMAEVDGDARARLIASRWSLLTVALLDEPPPAKEFIWENAIPVGDVGTFVGPGAAGKSATLVGLAVHMALGLPFLGRSTRHSQTVIVSLEDNFDDYRRSSPPGRTRSGPRGAPSGSSRTSSPSTCAVPTFTSFASSVASTSPLSTRRLSRAS